MSGGGHTAGAVFRINKDGSEYKAIKLFSGSTLDDPTSGWGMIWDPIVEGRDGLLYGAVYMADGNHMGCLFKMNKDGTGYSLLKRFQGNDGQRPHGGLVEGPDGTLYGTTEGGGTNDFGTLFRIRQDGSYFSVLHHFGTSAADGQVPQASMALASNGWLYGTTTTSSNSWGTVFKINTNGSGYGILRSFMGTNGDGRWLSAPLLLASDGVLYGTTEAGGSNDLGTVFKLRTDGSGYAVIKHFAGADGQEPHGKLAEGTNGALYGMTKLGGANACGVAFRLNRDGSDYGVLYSFGATTNDGVQPYAGLLAAKDGALYGTTYEGGDTARGTIFRIRELSNREPMIFTQPTNVTVCAGSTVTFAVAAVDNWPMNYRWRLNSTNLVGMDPILTLANVRWTNAGRYDCQVSNIYGCATSMVAVLTVIERPTITQQPHKAIVRPGEPATFNVVATNMGCSILLYQWRFSGINIAGATAATYTRTNCQWTDEGSYDVVVSSGCGTGMECGVTNSAPAALVLGSLPVIVEQPPSKSVRLGFSTEFPAFAEGDVPLYVQWYCNGLALTSGGRFAWPSCVEGTNDWVGLRASRLSWQDAGNYHLVLSNHCGLATSTVATLTITPPPARQLWAQYVGTNGTGRTTRSSPAVGADGTVYVGGDKFYAFYGATGIKRWEFATPGNVYSSPAVGDDGTVYIGADKVYALDGATGAKRWEYAVSGPTSDSSPALGADGTVYVGATDGTLYALNASTGVKRWEFATGRNTYTSEWEWGDACSPAVVADGTVYVVAVGRGWDGVGYPVHVFALEGNTGVKRWDFARSATAWSSTLAIDTGGMVYFSCYPVSHEGVLFALDGLTGAIRREFSLGIALPVQSPAIGPDGTFYLASLTSPVVALDGVSGEKRWEFATQGLQSFTPAVGADGTVYVAVADFLATNLVQLGSPGGIVYAVDGATGAKKWEFDTGGSRHSSPTIGPDGTVYVNSSSGYLYALRGNTPLANGPWPMRGRNARHTGSAEITTGPPVILSQPQSRTIMVGSNVVFQVGAGGARPLECQWFRNGVALTEGGRFRGVKSAVLTVDSVQFSDRGDYQVLVRNSLGQTSSIVAILTTLMPAGSLVWSFHGGRVIGAPAIAVDGTVYASCSDSNLYALDGWSGTQRWSFAATGGLNPPAVGADGTVYVGSSDTKLYALDPATGNRKWEFSTGGYCSSPAIGTDGTLYFASRDKKVYAVDGLTGMKRWEFTTADAWEAIPMIGADGTVYVILGWTAYALDGLTGAKRWESTRQWPLYPQAIGADGTVYADESQTAGNYVALNGSNGATRWTYFLSGSPISYFSECSAIGVDGTIYVGIRNDWAYKTGAGKILALNGATGQKRWDYTTANRVFGTPAVAADGTVYIGSSDCKFYALNGTTGAKRWEFMTGGTVRSPTISYDGIVCFGSDDGNIYALFGGSPPANSPWPMYGRDAQHTMRAGPLRPGPVELSLPGGQAMLRWSGDFMLQSASEVTGPWADLTGAINVYQVTPTAPRQFFRLRSN
jgi:uncharacterized repeat protein (TIGR03803 family)